jgi:hypothetical protein
MIISMARADTRGHELPSSFSQTTLEVGRRQVFLFCFADVPNAPKKKKKEYLDVKGSGVPRRNHHFPVVV